MRRFCALMLIAAVLMVSAVMWHRQSRIKEGRLSLDIVPGIDESTLPSGLLSVYSCDCEPDEILTLSEESQVANPSGLTDTQRPPGRIDIIVDTVDRTLSILSDGKVYREFTVAVGKPSTPSPPGQWEVVSKGAWSGGFGTRWLGLNMPWGKYGIHGTNKPHQIGDSVSGGCIRLFNRDVELIFDWIPIGTQVVITSHPFGPLRNPRRTLGLGERGTDVLAVQRRLRMLGFNPGAEDGIHGQATIDAVKRFQQAHSMRVTGIVTDEVYDALGLYLYE